MPLLALPLSALPSLLGLLLAAATPTLTPARVPARGAHTITVDVAETGMHHLEVRGGRGVACTLVDRQSGPLFSAGEVGRRDCAADELLAAGRYHLLLEGPARAAGAASVAVTPFTETQRPAGRLDRGHAFDGILRAGEQASFWVHVTPDQPFVWLRARGRTVGQVAIWRDGVWKEAVNLHGGRRDDEGGQPVYEWRVEETIEPGDYLFVVYGAAPLAWTHDPKASDPKAGDAKPSPADPDAFRVEAGFPSFPATARVAATLPATGVLTFALPLPSAVVALVLPQGPRANVSLGLHAIDDHGKVTFDQGGACTIAARAPEPTCALVSTSGVAQALEVRGPPGTALVLEAGAWHDPKARQGASDAPTFGTGATSAATGRVFLPPRNELAFQVAREGHYDVDLTDLPADVDAAPLTCQLVQGQGSSTQVVARDQVALPDTAQRAWSHAFNYDGSHEVVSFEVKSGRSVVLSLSGERHNHCELFRMEGLVRNRVATPREDDPTCRLAVTLTRGTYELQLDGGNEGIETLHAESAGKSGNASQSAPAANGTSTGGPWSGKTSCHLTGVSLRANEVYHLVTNRTARAAARGLLVNPAGAPIPPPLPWAPPAATVPYAPTPAPLAVLEPDHPAGFDFERESAHALVFDVKEAGVYELTTQGLLATSCALRAPTQPSLAEASGGGRGRNCLVQAYLGPGRYMARASTLGLSRGRAKIALSRHAPQEAPAVGLDEPGAWPVAAGELVRQSIVVPRGRKGRRSLALVTQSPGASLACRLEDAQGWPIGATHAPCTFEGKLAPGKYVWMQMPLSTEGSRLTTLSASGEATRLKGGRAHTVALNRAYDVELSGRGRDTFTFRVPGDLDARIFLNHGMEGRLLRQAEKGVWQPVDVIAPAEEDPADSAGEAPESEAPAEEAAEARPVAEGEDEAPAEGEAPSGGMSDDGPRDEGEGSASGEGAAAPENGEGEPSVETPPPSRPRKTIAERIAERPVTHLAAGRYRLVTSSREGDVGVIYQLSMVTEDLMPGLSRDLDVPFRGKLRVPTAGLLRLRTEGATDVTCRLFRGGRLIVENESRGADWNCGIEEPLPAGDYELAVEPAAAAPGSTHLVLDLAEPKAAALSALAPAGKTASKTGSPRLKVGQGALALPVPATTGEGLWSLHLAAPAPFSFALLDASGAVWERRNDTRDATLLVHAPETPTRLLLWTARGTEVSAELAPRVPVTLGPRDHVPADSVGRVPIARAGRYVWGTDIACLGAGEKGVLKACAREMSLAAGATLVAGLGRGRSEGLGLHEKDPKLEGTVHERWQLGARPYVQRQQNRTNAVHLLHVQLTSDTNAEPSCEFAQGVRALRTSECLAVGSAAPEALASVSLPSGDADAIVTRMAWPLPARVQSFTPGEIAVVLEKHGARVALPAGPWQTTLLLPAGAWAAVLGPAGVARDLCPAEGGLSRCVLGGHEGGELWLWARSPAPIAGRLSVGREPETVTLGGGHEVWEAWAAEPTVTKVSIPAANKPRQLRMGGAEGCVLHALDGTRLASCNAVLPAGQAFEALVSLGARPVRATLWANVASAANAANAASKATAPTANAAATPPEAGIALPPGLFARPATTASAQPVRTGEVVLLAGALVARTLELGGDGVVTLHATSGVCGLFDAAALRVAEGAGEGCHVARWLPRGRYTIAVRAFADRPLSGSLHVMSHGLETLAEGKGPRHALGPGDVDLYRFDVRAEGNVGLGIDAPAETLSCEILDAHQDVEGAGCQQLLSLKPGPHFLRVSSPRDARPLSFRPVLLGLVRGEAPVPAEYLEDLRQRLARVSRGERERERDDDQDMPQTSSDAEGVAP